MKDDSPERKRKIRYCTRMWLLQEIAGCTFIEARIHLRKERNESPEQLMKIYSLDRDTYLEIESVARSKAEAYSEKYLYRGYDAIYPAEDDIIEW